MTETPALATAPTPARKPMERTHHGDTVVDHYDWLRDKDNPEVIAHLNAENAYADRLLQPLEPLRDAIVEEIKSRTQETDTSVPFRDGHYWYISRTREGDDYPRYTRISIEDSPTIPQVDARSDDLLPGEEVYLDVQALAAGREFFSIGALSINEASNRLAYAVDTSGGEVLDVRIVDLDTGEVIDEAVTGVGYGLEFSSDGSQLAYTKNDDAWRQSEVWLHTIGTQQSEDHLLLREDDQKFAVYIHASRNGEVLVVSSASVTTSEVFTAPLRDMSRGLTSVAGRTPGLEYTVEHAGDHMLIVHNRDHQGFAIARQELGTEGPAAAAAWREIIAAADGERIESVDAFESHAAISMRSGGLPTVRIMQRDADGSSQTSPGWDVASVFDVSHGGDLDAVSLSHNRVWASETVRYTLDSLLTPTTVAEIPASGGQPHILKVTPVPGFDPSNYVEKRLWATAEDGTRIPVSLIARADARPDGSRPGFLYGYGSYEIPSDPALVVSWLSLLDRGIVVAIAHVRGGGEMGRPWYEGGKLLNKKNTFTDFVDVARFLVDEGWFARDRVAAEGGSAGGLLMGAVANLAPEMFRVIHARVPFVDALTTILDPTLPLTVGEWEEWGNPLESDEVYRYMKEYSPYENVRAVQYPAILATTSLNDIRVFYAEPAKWVARLREVTLNYADGSEVPDRPIAFKCEMVAGHGGRSGRYAKWQQRAEEFAFIVNELGARDKV